MLSRRVGRELAARGLVARGDRGLVALSGGPDSLCLLHVLVELAPRLGLALHAATVDHGLRAGSREEAELAAAHAAALGVPARVLAAPAGLARGPGNLQERARAARLALLEAEAARLDCAWIALGHTATDQAETVLMRALRGAGLRGIAAMGWRRGKLIRPLLGVTRAEIERELDARGLAPARDPSNDSDRFLRNRLRRHVLPLLERENPAVVEALCRLAESAREEGAALEAAARCALERARGVDEFGLSAAASRARGPNSAQFSLAELRALPPGLQHRCLRLAYVEACGDARRLTRAHLTALARLVASTHGTRWLDLPGVRAERRYDLLRLVRSPLDRAPLDEVLVPAPDASVPLPDGRVLRLQRKPPPGPPYPEPLHVLSESALSFPLVVRSARAGERIVVGQGISRKVARVLLDAKVPRAVRDQVPVVADRHGEVVLAVGVCAAHNRRARLGEPGALHVFVDISRNSI